MTTERAGRAAAWVALVMLLAGCATAPRGMDVHAPDTCYGKADPFTTYTLAYVDVPGFIEQTIATAADGALRDIGLDPADDPAGADLKVTNTFFLVDRNPPPMQGDPMGERVQTAAVNRFVAHLKVDVEDQRTGALIWTGSMYRDHAIVGGETFHDERAVLLIRKAFDEMFVGLTRPCG